jgi:hypothetical protein
VSLTNFDLHFADFTGREHVVRVASTDGLDWHLRASIDGRLFSKHCATWQGVERTLHWLRLHAHEPLPGELAPARGRHGLAAVAALLIALVPAMASAQPAPEVSPAETAFVTATRDYAVMHRRVEQAIGPLTVNADPATILRAIDAMAHAIRAQRFMARQGDLFTPALANELRARINDALVDHHFTAADVRVQALAEGIDPAGVPLRVNGAFPWRLSVAMFPCMIEALPPLPPELQYRIVANDLVLIDVHAGLIVDILANALADEDPMSGRR